MSRSNHHHHSVLHVPRMRRSTSEGEKSRRPRGASFLWYPSNLFSLYHFADLSPYWLLLLMVRACSLCRRRFRRVSTDERAKCAPCARRGCDRTSGTREKKRERDRRGCGWSPGIGMKYRIPEAEGETEMEAARPSGSRDSRAGRELLSFSLILVRRPRAIQIDTGSVYLIY